MQKYLLWVGIVLGVGLVGLLTVNTWNVYHKMVNVDALRASAEADRDQLKERTVDLERSVAELATPRGVEAEIRTRYPLVKAGETEFVLVNEQGAAVDTAPGARESIWSTITGWFNW